MKNETSVVFNELSYESFVSCIKENEPDIAIIYEDNQYDYDIVISLDNIITEYCNQTVVRDNVALFYKEAGSGDPPILLVHGGMDDHTHFSPQFEHFQLNHRTVTMDLRGYGQSDKPQQDYTITG